MINQLNEIESSKALDALEQHILAQMNRMDIPSKTNERLEQLKENQMLMFSTLINEMRFTRDFVKRMGDTLNE
jgi:hypothetical protein|tara:strand:- start:424 stop:642 length:219 start_codon:yes stop_codon:yes gene_type:complete